MYIMSPYALLLLLLLCKEVLLEVSRSHFHSKTAVLETKEKSRGLGVLFR